MKKKIIFVGILFVVVFFIITKNTSSINSDFRGTFGSGEFLATVYISIDGREGENAFYNADQMNDDWEGNNAFYYADQMNEIFIKGTFIQISKGMYRFSCTQPNDIIKDQDILYDKGSFSLNVSGVTRKFQKVGNLPTLYRDPNEYK